MIKGLRYLLCFSLLSSSCQAQKIRIPDPLCKKLFGQWIFHSSSGGFTGQGADWATTDNIIILFKNNGTYQRTGKAMPAVKDTFKFVKGASILSEEQVYLIDYKNNIDQSFSIKGDTLFLFDEVHDGFSYTFLRKKK